MRLNEITSAKEQQQLDEILPVLGAVAGGVARGAAALGGAALKGGAALAKGVGSVAKTVGGAVSQGAKAIGQAATSAVGMGGAEDPAAQAQQVIAAKNEVQDQIKQKQQELQALQQQLTQIK